MPSIIARVAKGWIGPDDRPGVGEALPPCLDRRARASLALRPSLQPASSCGPMRRHGVAVESIPGDVLPGQARGVAHRGAREHAHHQRRIGHRVRVIGLATRPVLGRKIGMRPRGWAGGEDAAPCRGRRTSRRCRCRRAAARSRRRRSRRWPGYCRRGSLLGSQGLRQRNGSSTVLEDSTCRGRHGGLEGRSRRPRAQPRGRRCILRGWHELRRRCPAAPARRAWRCDLL